jgi:hypothetical protein
LLDGVRCQLKIFERSSNSGLSAQITDIEVESQINTEGLYKHNRKLLLKLLNGVELSNSLFFKNLDLILEYKDFKIKEMSHDINNFHILFMELKKRIKSIPNNRYLRTNCQLLRKDLIPIVEKMNAIFELIQKRCDKEVNFHDIKEVGEMTQDPSENPNICDVQESELLERDKTIQFSMPQSKNATENKIHKSQTIFNDFENTSNPLSIPNRQETELNEMKETIKNLVLDLYEIQENTKRKS